MRDLGPERICLARATAQRLAGERATSVVDAVRRVVGVQGQDVRATRLSVRVRTGGLSRSAVDRAVNADRTVVRTWAMRGTLHLLAAEDVGWIVGLLGPYFAGRLTGRRRQLGLDEATCERGVAALRTVLAGGPLNRTEVVERLADHGVVLDPKSQAPAHLLAYAAMTGVVCRGPDLEKDEASFVLLSDWVGERRVPDDPLLTLAGRYLDGYGPAGAEDFATWSGLPLGRAREAFARLSPTEVAVPEAGRPQVRLLGHFDTYLLGYRSRELAVPPEHDRKIQSGGGFIMPAVLVDGRVVGTWKQAQRKGHVKVAVEPFGRIGRAVERAIGDEVADLGRFLGLPAGVIKATG
jgi:hypothetical protein